MAAITSAGSGNWSAGGTWVGGVAPTSADTCTIANGHTVTLDTTGCVCSALTLNTGGTLKGHRTVASDLTVHTTITCAVGSVLDFGAPSDEITASCVITLNEGKAAWRSGALTQTNQANAESCDWSFCGDPSRVRVASLASSAASGQPTFTLNTSAHGWQAGDAVILQDTTNTNANRFSYGTILSTSGANITLNANLAYSHAAGCVVGNMTSNLRIRSTAASSNQGAGITLNAGDYNSSSGTHRGRFRDVEFYNLGENSSARHSIYVYTNVPSSTTDVSFTDCVFNNLNYVFVHTAQSVGLTDCVSHATGTTGQDYSTRGSLMAVSGGIYTFAAGFNQFGSAYNTFSNVALVAKTGAYVQPVAGAYTGCTISGYAKAFNSTGEDVTFTNCAIPASFDQKLFDEAGFIGRNARYTLNNCTLSASAESPTTEAYMAKAMPGSVVSYTNKGAVSTAQEKWTPNGVTKRDNSTYYRSTSSVSIKPIAVGRAETKTISVPCANGASIRLVGYCRFDTSFYNSNDYTAPTVTISGLGISPVTFTASSAANGAWEKFDLSATNSSGSDGSFTVTQSASAKTVVTGTVYFDGVPDAPFVTKCRHYGFNFDESSPVRVVNPYVSASEATAIAYTGVTLNNGTKNISFGAGTADTAQKFYDYIQALMCANLSYEVPLVRAGALLSLTTGWTVADPTYSGVTWGGGNIEWNSTGNKDGSFDSCDFTFKAVGTYTFSDATFGGTIELINASGSPITVELPTGTSYTNTGPNITVSTPQIYQSVTLSGVAAGSRCQIYDTTNSLELLNSTAATSWTDSNPAAGSRAIRIRVSKVSGATAKEFIEANIGTCGTTEPSNALTYLVSQADDAVYNANAINGSTVTGITFTDAATDIVNIDVASNAVTWPQIYAAFVYWISTASGIADDIAYIAAKDTANYTLTSMKIKNTSSPMEPLVVSGGYGIDSTTGTSLPLADTTGGTLIFAPDHVVAYQTSGTYAITGDISTVLAAIPSDTDNAAAVRTNLATELARIDVATSTRLATAGYTAPDNAGIADIDAKTEALADIQAKTDQLTFTTGKVHADAKSMNGAAITGTGTSGDKWRGA